LGVVGVAQVQVQLDCEFIVCREAAFRQVPGADDDARVPCGFDYKQLWVKGPKARRVVVNTNLAEDPHSETQRLFRCPVLVDTDERAHAFPFATEAQDPRLEDREPRPFRPGNREPRLRDVSPSKSFVDGVADRSSVRVRLRKHR
jgi:hypothetical protein